jgi:hypothetical protein
MSNRYKLTIVIRKVNDPDERKSFLFDDIQQALNTAVTYKENLGENVDVFLNKEG